MVIEHDFKQYNTKENFFPCKKSKSFIEAFFDCVNKPKMGVAGANVKNHFHPEKFIPELFPNNKNAKN